MARATGAQVRAIAATAVQETLRRKVLYVIVFLVLIVGFISVSSATVLRMVAESGEEEHRRHGARQSRVLHLLSLWAAAAQFLALFLGAVGLSSETGAKTSINVLSRPVDRSVYLTGRWTGLLAFLWVFQLAGIVLGSGMALAFHVPLASTLWIGLAGDMRPDCLLRVA